MPTSIDQNTMRRIIMDHYEDPDNRGIENTADYLSAHMDSASCIDDITIRVKMGEDGRIADCRWDGTCCVISTAATSVATELSIGKTPEEVERIYESFHSMLMGEEYDATLLGDGIAFCNTGRQPSRIGCATIGFRGILECLKEGKKDA